MTQRAEALEETRRRILDATMQVHDAVGMLDARWEDIARRAGVSLSTMYRHFSSTEELVAACGKLTFQEFPPPHPGSARAVFVGLHDVERLERLVEEAYGYYERTDPMMAMVRRDMHRSQALAEGLDVIHTGIEAFIVEALKPLSASRAQMALARAVLDDRTWASLIDAGLKPGAARREAVALLRPAMGL